MSKNVWKRAAALIMALALCFALCSVCSAEEGRDLSKDLNLVILIDASGSMLTTDPDEVAVQAAMMFIANCKRGNSTVSVYDFTWKETPIPYIVGTLESDEHAGSLISALDPGMGGGFRNRGLNYQSGLATRIGFALAEGVQQIERNASEDRNNLIILFSDGENDGDLDNQTNKQEEAIHKALDLKCPIYTVGVNYQNSMSEAGEKNLKTIAGSTGGQCRIFTSMDGVQEYFNEIYTDFFGYDPDPTNSNPIPVTGDYQEKELHVPKYVAEANVNLINGQELMEFSLYDPDGNEVKPEDPSAYFSVNRLFTAVKLTEPKEGNWRVRFRGVEGDNVFISFLPNYDLKLGEELSGSQVRIGEEAVLTLYVMYQGRRIRGDQAFYDSIAVGGAVYTDDGSPAPALRSVATGDGVELRFVPDSITGYTVKGELQGEGFRLTGTEHRVQAVNTAPTAVGTLQDISLRLPKEKDASAALAGLFQDPDLQFGQKLEYTVETSGDKDAFSAVIRGDQLFVEGLKAGSGAVTVTARDNAGASVQLSAKVTVTDITKLIRIAILAVAALILLIAAIILIRILTRKLRGPMNASVSEPQTCRQLITPINLSGRSMTLKEFLDLYRNRYAEDHGGDCSGLEQLMNSFDKRRILDRVVFCGVNGQDGRLEIKASFRGEGGKMYVNGNEIGRKTVRIKVEQGDNVDVSVKIDDVKDRLSMTLYYGQDDEM